MRTLANGHGGPRTPARPAPASGPGALSRRTDGGPASPATPITGLPYGENQDFNEIQTSAPLGATAPKPRMSSGTNNPQGGLVPFGAPTQRPDEPVTTGNPLGPGAGPGVLTQPIKPRAADVAILAKYMPQLRHIASQSDAPEGFKAFVQYLNGQ